MAANTCTSTRFRNDKPSALAGCTSAFEHGVLCVYQLQYAKDRRVLPITRDYMAVAEAKLRAPA